MKKLSLILASALIFGGISFASPVVKQDKEAPVAQQQAKPAVKPAVKPSKPATGKRPQAQVHYKKPVTAKNTTK